MLKKVKIFTENYFEINTHSNSKIKYLSYFNSKNKCILYVEPSFKHGGCMNKKIDNNKTY